MNRKTFFIGVMAALVLPSLALASPDVDHAPMRPLRGVLGPVDAQAQAILDGFSSVFCQAHAVGSEAFENCANASSKNEFGHFD